MVRDRSTPAIFGGHFHGTRFGMFQSRAGIALNPTLSRAANKAPALSPHSKATSKQRLLHGAGCWIIYTPLGMLSRRKCSPQFSPPSCADLIRASPADGRVKHGH